MQWMVIKISEKILGHFSEILILPLKMQSQVLGVDLFQIGENMVMVMYLSQEKEKKIRVFREKIGQKNSLSKN